MYSNQRSKTAEEAANLKIAFMLAMRDGEIDAGETGTLWEMVKNVHVSAEVQDAALGMIAQLLNIPMSAPNRSQQERVSELAQLMAAWGEMKSHLGGRSTEAA